MDFPRDKRRKYTGGKLTSQKAGPIRKDVLLQSRTVADESLLLSIITRIAQCHYTVNMTTRHSTYGIRKPCLCKASTKTEFKPPMGVSRPSANRELELPQAIWILLTITQKGNRITIIIQSGILYCQHRHSSGRWTICSFSLLLQDGSINTLKATLSRIRPIHTTSYSCWTVICRKIRNEWLTLSASAHATVINDKNSARSQLQVITVN